MIPLEKYARAKDHCCIGYFGPDFGTVVELLAARPVIESVLPGLKVYISCRAEFASTLQADRLIPSNELKLHRHEFAFFSEVRSDGQISPVQQLLRGIQPVKRPV